MAEKDGSPVNVGITAEHRLRLLSLHNGTLVVPDLELQCAELRSIYHGNSYALEEIDFNDFNSPYSLMLMAYNEALRGNDPVAVQEFDNWFNTHYPLHAESL